MLDGQFRFYREIFASIYTLQSTTSTMLLPATLRRGPAVLFFFSCILFFLPCLFIINLNYPLRVVNPLAHFGTKEEPITSTTELDREQVMPILCPFQSISCNKFSYSTASCVRIYRHPELNSFSREIHRNFKPCRNSTLRPH